MRESSRAAHDRLRESSRCTWNGCAVAPREGRHEGRSVAVRRGQLAKRVFAGRSDDSGRDRGCARARGPCPCGKARTEGTGFCARSAPLGATARWRTVRRSHPVIDRDAFVRGVRARVSMGSGCSACSVVSAIGVVSVVEAVRRHSWCCGCGRTEVRSSISGGDSSRSRSSWLAALVIGTHSHRHWVVGRLVGFAHTRVLATAAASGPDSDRLLQLPPRVASSSSCHACVGRRGDEDHSVRVAVGASRLLVWQWWSLRWILIGVGVVQIVTDVTLSTRCPTGRRRDGSGARRRFSASGRS